jgi:hypothetical protein
MFRSNKAALAIPKVSPDILMKERVLSCNKFRNAILKYNLSMSCYYYRVELPIKLNEPFTFNTRMVL